MFKALKNVMEFYDLHFENLAGMTTDGAPCMIGKHSGLVAFLKKQDVIDKNAFMDFYCIIHQENLGAKMLQFDAIMKVVNNAVKFIPEKALNHHQFQNFLTSKWEADHSDMTYYCNVHWLSHANKLKRIIGLKDPIQEFTTLKINQFWNLTISNLCQILHFSLIYLLTWRFSTSNCNKEDN